MNNYRILFLISISLNLTLSGSAFSNTANAMTIQIPTEVEYGGVSYVIEQMPLLEIVNHDKAPELVAVESCNWKAYEAKWFIQNNKLLLVGFEANGEKRKLKIGDFIKGGHTPMVATWFTGKIHLKIGEHNKKTDKWPAVVSLKIEKGKIIDIEVGKNVDRRKLGHNTWNGLPRIANKKAKTPEK